MRGTMKELVFKKTEQGDLRTRIYEPDNSKDSRCHPVFLWRCLEGDDCWTAS